jgi:hypothetical protein
MYNKEEAGPPAKKAKNSPPTKPAALPTATGKATEADQGTTATGGGGTGGGGGGGRGGGGRRRSGSSGFAKTAADPTTKGCFVTLVGNPGDFIALATGVRDTYCKDFSTVGLACPGGCGKKHTWYDRMTDTEKKAQEDYVEKYKDRVRFNKESYGVRKNLPDNKQHLLSDAGEK